MVMVQDDNSLPTLEELRRAVAAIEAGEAPPRSGGSALPKKSGLTRRMALRRKTPLRSRA